MLSITIGMGVIFLITNRVNKQIIFQTKVWIINVILQFWLSRKKTNTPLCNSVYQQRFKVIQFFFYFFPDFNSVLPGVGRVNWSIVFMTLLYVILDFHFWNSMQFAIALLVIWCVSIYSVLFNSKKAYHLRYINPDNTVSIVLTPNAFNSTRAVTIPTRCNAIVALWKIPLIGKRFGNSPECVKNIFITISKKPSFVTTGKYSWFSFCLPSSKLIS